MSHYSFSVDWFSASAPIWNQLLSSLMPGRLLEVGSFEGRSACHLIEFVGNRRDIELHCIDTFQGGVEHAGLHMNVVEQRFRANTDIAKSRASHAVNLVVHKAPSDIALARLLSSGEAEAFDFVYIDGSHQAPDVLADAVLAFRLLRTGGLMVFDDYLWAEDLPGGCDPLRMPKPAIDAFVNLYARKVRVLRAPLYQLFVQKVAA